MRISISALGFAGVVSTTLMMAITDALGVSVDYSCIHSAAWLMNENNDYSENFGASTDISSSKIDSDSWSTMFNRIPNYERVFTQEDIEELNSRPNAATDFDNGETSAKAGEKYAFGDDIGYLITHQGCELGYWPPGPECPTASSKTISWDLSPAPEEYTGGCFMPMLGAVGYWVNGASIFGSSDGTTYNNENVWFSSAPEFERYDLDVCAGHAANSEYHHHNHPNCLQERLGDIGDAHSPVYGWLLDSYPIYGPYQANGVLAETCWKKRDYSSNSTTGCSDGARSCQLLDQYDYTKGTVEVAAGPSLTGTVTTQSGNVISAASGIYLEDYYFDTDCYSQNSGMVGGLEGNKYLDSSNGHSHGDYGYHYHTTLNSEGDFVFPYTAGPKFYGCRASQGQCCTTKNSMNCANSNSVCGSTNATTTHACSKAA